MGRRSLKFKNGDNVNNKQGNVTIINYENKNHIVVQFENGYRLCTNAKSLSNGTVKNPYFPTICGKGYLGETSPYVEGSKERKNSYYRWKAMLTRCYSNKSNHSLNYFINVTVCDEWLCYEVFEKWYNINYIEGFHLDKDFKVRGSTTYSPETCSFIPQELNSIMGYNTQKEGFVYKDLPTGVSYHKKEGKYYSQCQRSGKPYFRETFDSPDQAFRRYKEVKEEDIKNAAEIYYSKGSICKQVYETLLEWEVQPFSHFKST